SIADRYPNTADAADGLFRGGRIRESLGDLDGAAASYRRVIGSSAAGTRSADAQFRLAFVQFEQGNMSQAADSLRILASQLTAADQRAQAFFWLGKALNAQGDAAGARSAWTSANSADPRGFYGLRAVDWLAGLAEPTADVEKTLALVRSHAADDPAALVTPWVASRGDVANAQAALAADPGRTRADALLAMGLRQPAIW